MNPQSTPSYEKQPRDAAYWAQYAATLKVARASTGALNLNVEGRRAMSPLQGFGQMWQKTFRIRMNGAQVKPAEVIKTWKERFPTFWPKWDIFYKPLTGIAPGEVALINMLIPGDIPHGLPLSTGVLVLYADEESCSANYDILGLIVQRVSGEPYATYVQQHIFAPLQMHDSFASEQEARRDGLAQGHRWLFGVPVPFDYYNASGLPAGYLSSSAQDLTHYLIAQMNGGRFESATVLSSAGIATMHAPAVAITEGAGTGSSYGMGWINGPLAGVPAIWHGGEDYNFHSLLLIEPQTHWGVVLLVNANNLIPVDGAGNTALQSLQDGLVCFAG